MGEVVRLVTDEQAERAWQDYSALAREVVDNPTLLLDRAHRQAFYRAERRYKELFLRLDRA